MLYEVILINFYLRDNFNLIYTSVFIFQANKNSIFRII